MSDGSCDGTGAAHQALAIRSRPTHANGYRLTCLDELEAADRTYADLLERALKQGDESAPSHLLGRRSVVRMLLGRAHQLARRSLDLASPRPVADHDVEAWLGRPHARGGESALWTLGHVALCEARFEDAMTAFAALTEPILECGVREPGELRWLFDEIEARVLAGRMAEARARAAQLTDMATATGRPTTP